MKCSKCSFSAIYNWRIYKYKRIFGQICKLIFIRFIVIFCCHMLPMSTSSFGIFTPNQFVCCGFTSRGSPLISNQVNVYISNGLELLLRCTCVFFACSTPCEVNLGLFYLDCSEILVILRKIISNGRVYSGVYSTINMVTRRGIYHAEEIV